MNHVDPIQVTQKVVHQGVTTVELDNLATETAANLATKHPDYAILAPTGKPASMVSEETYQNVMAHKETLDSAIIYNCDFSYIYFGFKTLELSYLIHLNGHIAEQPQHMIMRVAVGIHSDNIEHVLQTYNLMSEQYFTHATPTLFNAGIYDTLKNYALICKSAGGIGISIHNIRATRSYIAGTNGYSNGIVPMLRAYNATARYVDQGGNKRPGAFAIYLVRARDLFYALWKPDLFMKCVEGGGNRSLFCPNEPLDFMRSMATRGWARETVPAQKLWYAILKAQIETGNPFMLYKDACNEHGVIKSSNLCTEIIEYSSPDEPALHDVAKTVTIDLNRVMDRNYYPIPEARHSNMRSCPIGIGAQGLANAFMALKMPFDSPEAKELNLKIFETIYHGAAKASCKMAKADGPYEAWMGSPAQQGQLQYDLWGITPTDLWDWDTLKEKIAKYGLRNSLLTALMPTAPTSQMLGFNKCVEPYTSNIYTCRVLSGEFQVAGLWQINRVVNHGGGRQRKDGFYEHTPAHWSTTISVSQDARSAGLGKYLCGMQGIQCTLSLHRAGMLSSRNVL
ncbi:hypothetical protein BT96DRAFT_958461 [Gymnopus androsaceus JB14]|uniref:Ribonucleotide reductase large subunit domain-containing protein n=1 Tax=Gymnopus androsaceus JB14 TaxID=1447944 RepID=A0A6A4HC63_9AGAR|nr:hypothetical protein BT96DRAFT_958461 [Gymnopus androsaceus JB14]